MRSLFLCLSLIFSLVAFPTRVWGEIQSLEPSSLVLPANLTSTATIRVLLLDSQEKVKIFSRGPFRVETIETAEFLGYHNPRGPFEAWPIRNGLKLAGEKYKIYGVRIVPESDWIEIGGKSFRGQLIVIRGKEGKLLVVNEIDLERYLEGVLSNEVYPNWPLEVLKAQAVASRTYALFKSLMPRTSDFDVTSDVWHQVYGGASTELRKASEAVRMTRGEILTFQGQIFPAYFHSTCGGHTARASSIWPIEDHPALQGRECPFCRDSRYYTWQSTVSLKTLEGRLKHAGHKVSQISRIQPRGKDESGRFNEIRVTHGAGELALAGNDFRMILGPDLVRSLRELRVRRRFGSMEFFGSGWGHGAGLCQFGAKTQAENGKKYVEILQYYFPGTELRRL